MKYYGVFHFTARGGTWGHKNALLSRIYYEFIKKDDHCSDFDAMNKSQLANSRQDENLKAFLNSWKEWYKYDRQTSRCQMFSTKYMIHECDENGYWIPTKKELEEAEKFMESR